MAYVYNQNKDDEIPQSGSNIFGSQPQPGGQPGSDGFNKTGDTGIIGAGGAAGGGQEKSAEQVQQQSANQRSAAFPLREIMKRNTASQVGAPDFSKTSNAIANAGTAFQTAANAYTAGNVEAVPTINQGTINTYAGIPSATPPPAQAAEATATTPAPATTKTAAEAGNEITAAITPRQAALTQFEMPKEAALPSDSELQGRFNTSSGLTNEILKANPVVGQSRGAAGLDTAFLQGNTAFQKSKDAILASGSQAGKERATALAALPETTRVAVQSAIDTAATNAKAMLASTASGYEADAKTKQEAFEAARKDLQGKIDSGNLTPEMKAQILAEFDKQVSGFTPNQQGLADDFKGFLSDPNRMSLTGDMAREVTDYGGDAGNFNLSNFDDKNLASGFKVAGTPTNQTSFMSDEQYNPWSKISSLLGKDVTRGAAATTQPLSFDPTNLTNAAMQYQGMKDISTTGKKNYDSGKTIVQKGVDELNELKRRQKQYENNPRNLNSGIMQALAYDGAQKIAAKEAEVKDLFGSHTAKLSPAKKAQFQSELKGYSAPATRGPEFNPSGR